MSGDAYHLTPFDVFTTRSTKKQFHDEHGRVQLETSFLADKGQKYIMLYLGAMPLRTALTLEEIDRRMKDNGWVFIGERDTHTEHCCFKHGCKYGDDNCPVTTRKKLQSEVGCERCSEDREEAVRSDVVGDRADGPRPAASSRRRRASTR